MIDHHNKRKPAGGGGPEWWPSPLGDRLGVGLREPRAHEFREPRPRRNREYAEKRPPWLEARHIRKGTRGRHA